jgi:chaperonin cofactor prefoldin
MICYLIAVLSVFGSLAADAVVADLQALKSARRELTVRLDSLAPQRAAIEAELRTLSTVIDSLKRSTPESEQLNEVYLSLNAPMEKVSGIDSEMEKISARRDSVTDALRAAYDWEISTLFKSLSEEPDGGLLQQLIIFQDERRALGEQVVASRMRYAEDMVVNDADGPDQIRQKIQFLEGKKGLLQSEVRRVEARIKRLEAERRLAKGMSGLAEKMWALERRHLFKGRSAFKTRARAGEMAPAVPAATTSQGAPQTRAKGDSGPISNYIALEIRKLYARQEELGQIVAVLEERVGTFRLHLRELLDGRE